jgi:hypothetical protein
MTDRPSLQQQVDEVTACFLSRKAAVRQRRDAMSRGKPVPPDTGCNESGLPCMEAAIVSLEWLRDHQDIVREVIAARKGAE